VIALEFADLIVIASHTLGLDTGQVLDLLDPAAAELALDQARPGSESEPAVQAAILLHALVRQRPLRRGNCPIALAAMLQFLALNGWHVDPDPPGQVASMVTDLAHGTRDTRSVADWLAPRLRPDGKGATVMKETSMRRRNTLAERLKMATMRTQPKGLFGRFTGEARRAVQLAQEEARLLGHSYVGTEHLLLGLLYQGEGIGPQALASMNISLQDARAQVEELTVRGQNSRAGHLPFTMRAKKVLELALREALRLGHHYIGTEHVVLGMLREGDGIAAQVLIRLGANYARVSEHVVGLLAEREQAGRPTPLVSQAIAEELADTAELLTQVRREKEAAFDAGDLKSAAALRDREKQLLADKVRLEYQLAGDGDIQVVIAENLRLHREVDRLRELLRQHRIEPDDGTARTA
jgi:Clp amino terminal domain, pathogenicity island component